jgi:hypothetical protein
MLPTPLAIAWPLWRRHRKGLLAVLGYFGALAVLTAIVTVRLDPETVTAILGPISLSLVGPAAYLTAVFSYGVNADVNAPESCFPATYFRLPLRTAALVAWPVVFGAAAAALFWLGIACFIFRPWFAIYAWHVHLWWPAALAAAVMGWFQAMLWVPLGLAGLRIVFTVAIIVALIAAAQLQAQAGAAEVFLVSLFTGLAALSWIVSYLGVTHARRGDVPDWSALVRPVRQLARSVPRRRAAFANAARAQVWFEWRRTGPALSILTALVLPLVLFPLTFGTNDAIPIPQALVSALFVPVFFAGLAGTTVSGNHPWVKDYYGVAPFAASLPLTTAAMVAAKLKAAALSALAAWALTILVTVAAVVLTGNGPEVTAWWQRGVAALGPGKLIVAIAGAAALLVTWTWKRLVDGLLLGLTGRKWLIHCNIYLNIAALVGLGALGAWMVKNPAARETLLAMAPWLLALWVLCRAAAASWAVREGLRRQLISGRTVQRWLPACLAAGLLLFGALAWVVPWQQVAPQYVAFAVLLVLPMAHLAVTPLALAWNRHR